MPDPQRPIRESSLALNGQNIKIDEIKSFSLPPSNEVTITSKYENYIPAEDIDYTDLKSINSELSQLRIRLHYVRNELKIAERKATALKYQYDSKKKRLWIGITGGSDKSREAMAELMCEEEYSRYLVAATVAKEITQHSRDMRNDLDTLKEISNNLRRQIDLQ
jgi:hypothetical protein